MLVSPSSPCHSSTKLQVRSCYRVAEYTAGGDSDIAHSEVAFYLLDTIPMLLFTVINVIVWPPNVIDEQVIDTSIDMAGRQSVLKPGPDRQTASMAA
jgi:hypothetical protein